MKELPETSKRALKMIEERIRTQNSKGLAEYGKTIDEAKGYDWTHEALSECVDALQYIVRRMIELEERELVRRESMKHMARHIMDLEEENERLKASQRRV